MSDQQKRVYAAEATLDKGATFTSYVDAQAWADALTARNWWSEQYGFVRRIELQGAPEGEPATGSYDEDHRVAVAAIPRSMLNTHTILHEVAHATVGGKVGHNHVWTRELLKLVYMALGSDRYLALYESFTNGGVLIDPPAKEASCGS
jgi:hypothetical protein